MTQAECGRPVVLKQEKLKAGVLRRRPEASFGVVRLVYRVFEGEVKSSVILLLKSRGMG